MTYPTWGWGTDESQAPKPADLQAVASLLPTVAGFAAQSPETPAPLPDGVSEDRACHSAGRSYRDVVRALRGQLPRIVDRVVRPSSEAEVAEVLERAAGARAAVIPYGGGTSVVGGVTPEGVEAAEVWSLDLSGLSGIVEVDQVSRAARVRAGTTGPALDAGLKEHGLTARFYPQSFERSTVGGWIATRAAGHFATKLQHVDDLVESVRAVTPAGIWESRRLPGSAAGPSPDRMLLGSEGILGVVTEAWLRVQDRPAHRASATLTAPSLEVGAAAVRALAQGDRPPATVRLLDAREAELNGVQPAGTGLAVLLLGDEGAAPVSLDAAVEAARDSGCSPLSTATAGGEWRGAFLRAPYLRDSLVLLGVLAETFETATTWERLDALVSGVTGATEAALREVCGAGTVSCRLTHAYADGAAPYFTVVAPARRGSELAQWAEVKSAASEAILAHGGTITHHHAVGRDHRHWYDRQRPDLFAAALGAAKTALDPAGILNPGVLLDPPAIRP